MNFKFFFLENELKGKNLVIVDVQPEYQQYFEKYAFSIRNFTKWINKKYNTFNKVLFLFNGPSLGMISEDDLKLWYIENGLKEDVVYESEFFDKGYAFFRTCIDNNVSESDIVYLVKYMLENNINDSRQLEETGLWDKFEERYSNTQLRSVLEHTGDMIYIPDVMDVLKKYGNNIVLVGGGAAECLKEVEIALNANDQEYTQIAEWVY